MIRGFHVRPGWTLAAGAIALAVVSTTARANVIDTIPEWAGERSNSWDNVAQTLIVPFDKPILATFELGVGSDEPDRTFRLRIFEWDRSVEHTIGAELFSSGPFASPVGTVDFMVFDIGIGLTGGAEYAVIVDWGPDGGTGSGVAFIVGSPYGDGYANFSSGPFDETWSFDQNSGFDLAFRAEFVPAPGVLSLLGAVMLLSRRRRR